MTTLGRSALVAQVLGALIFGAMFGGAGCVEAGDPLALLPTVERAERVEAPGEGIRPEPPRILRDVAMIDDEVRFTHPFVPGHRTTMDGRVAVRVQGGLRGVTRLDQVISFFLFVPERLEEPIVSGPSGAQILHETEPYDVVFPPALDPAVVRLGHHAICDPTEEFPRPGERPNPYPCGAGGASDCYDLVLISTTSDDRDSQLWGTDVTVEVEAPKTPVARIARVSLGEPVRGAMLPNNREWTEPAVTVDGRMLTGRFGRAARRWTNPNTGETLERFYDISYSVLPEGSEPCDVRGWTQFHPISHAPYDPQMVGRYGLAAYPLRDAEGNPIPDGEDVGGTYPWVDREGANLFMAGVHGRLREQSEARYPRRCVHEGCERYAENTDWDRGFLVAGLWTHGKFVHLDAMINNMDWAVGVSPATHFEVDLYRDAAGEEVPVRLGSGRFINDLRASGPYPAGYTHNANILDSLQNLPNHHEHARPVTPRDVVWLMSTGVATDEVAFDDLLDPDAFILSNMQATVTPLYSEAGESLGMPRHWNGQVRDLLLPLNGFYVLQPELDEDIHLQNAATSLRWRVPAYGRIEAGTARIEPVALGGVTGRGLWLSGEAAARYAVPAQDRPVRDRSWYFGLFLDARAGAGGLGERTVARFPDGSALLVDGERHVERIRYLRGGSVVHEVELPEGAGSEGWIHLGLLLRSGNREVTLFLDGFALDRFVVEEPLFEMVEGELVIGAAGPERPGFRGWIDELVVLAHGLNLEVACNHAHGTLAELLEEGALAALAARYPAWAHEEVALAAGIPAERHAICYHDYSRDHAAHLHNLPAGAAGLRERINFPEGPLRAGEPRPDSSGNAFCLSCHHEEGQGGLSLAALAYDPSTPAEQDRRRQPTQPPRRVFGNIPAGWIPATPGPDGAPGSPEVPTRAPPEGLLIDLWTLPGPR